MERPFYEQGTGIVQGVAQQGISNRPVGPGAAGAAGAAYSPGEQGLPNDGGDAQSAFEDFWKPGGFLDDGETELGANNSVLVTQPQLAVASGESKKKLLLLLLTLLLFVGAIGIAVYVFDWDPMGAISELMQDDPETVSASSESSPEKKNGPSEDVESELREAMFAEPADEETPNDSSVVEGNPYWALPNAIEGYSPIYPIWTAVQEEEWRGGIAHKYPYQRLKTVQEVRRSRRRGAQTILWEALEDKKAWPRLYAAIGLAEYNIPIANKVLIKAIGPSRPELIAGFFERFVKKPNPGQAYIMRQAVRMLDEAGRLTCLRGIWNTRDRFRDLYIAAATQDPSPAVREWVGRVLLQRSMPLARFDGLVAMVQGKAPLVGFDVAAGGTSGQSSGSDAFDSDDDSMGDADAENSSGSDKAVPRDLSRGKKLRASDQGDVMFFDPVPKASKPNRKPRPSSVSNAAF